MKFILVCYQIFCIRISNGNLFVYTMTILFLTADYNVVGVKIDADKILILHLFKKFSRKQQVNDVHGRVDLKDDISKQSLV